jgi:predicted transcriptional regulator
MSEKPSTLELARAVSRYISEELEKSDHDFITLPRNIAEFALAFTNAAIESLEGEASEAKRFLS